MAFQPFWVGMVTPILTAPRALRTLRITPGTIEAMDSFRVSNVSKTERRPPMIECSIFSLSLTARKRTAPLTLSSR